MTQGKTWAIDTSSLKAWSKSLPTPRDVTKAVSEAINAAPRQWREPMQTMGFDKLRSDAPEWVACLEALERLRAFEDAHGNARKWAMHDAEICDLADKLAAAAIQADRQAQRAGLDLPQRLDKVRAIVRTAGIEEPRAIKGEAAIARAQDARWWRRALRVHVARVVEAGAIKLGIVNRKSGGYASNNACTRRAEQIARNAAALSRTLYRNEAGQVFTLTELAARSVANPTIRGGELMTRIRGAEEYATERAHVGLFVTLTCPSRMHAMTVGSGGRPIKNKRYDGTTTPRDAQQWLCKTWARARAALRRRGVRMYGLRVAEPHHDGTPHWHALLWVANEEQARILEDVVRAYWLSEDGDEPGARKNRINVKRLIAGGAAGYIAKYIAKSVGHVAMAEHLDGMPAQGELLDVDTGDMPGHRRVDAWASTWGIRQFQAVGMPPVTVWRELRRVTSDQAEHARVTWRDGAAWAAWAACGARWANGLDGKADWATYMRAMGGHCARPWSLRLARRAPMPGETNRYGESVEVGRVVGVECNHGRWLISRRQAWAHIAATQPAQSDAERAQRGAPWTGFNNCTARIDWRKHAALFTPQAGERGADRMRRAGLIGA